DIAHSRAVDYPVWSTDITPTTGKWRLETVEINGPIQIGDVRVAAGDLVVADDTGVCFIPRDLVLEVLGAAEPKANADALRGRARAEGFRAPALARATCGEKKYPRNGGPPCQNHNPRPARVSPTPDTSPPPAPPCPPPPLSPWPSCQRPLPRPPMAGS